MKAPKQAEPQKAPAPAQRQADEALQRQVNESPRQQAQQAQIAQLQGEPEEENLTGMPSQLKQGIEALSGMDMSDVRVHRNSDQPAQLNALAYAQGNDIHLGPGQEEHLPHEAWHVVQQRQGRVKPTLQMKEGVPVNDDAGLEREADVMGGRAISLKSANSDTVQLKPPKKKEASQEEQWKEKIKEHDFGDGQVAIAGMGEANADISASDGKRLWMFEVKGGNIWGSKDNINHEGNTPAKQISRKLFGSMNKKIKTKAVSDEEGVLTEVSVEDALKDSDLYPEAHAQILLGASNLDIADALLGLQYNTDPDEKGFVKTKGASLPLSISGILGYLEGVTFDVESDETEYQSNHWRNVNDIAEEWGEWKKDGRSYFVQNPERLGQLEQAYSMARKKGSAHTLHGEDLDALDDEMEFRLLPVVKDLINVDKPAQLKGGVVQRQVDEVAQRRKFKNEDEARKLLHAKLVGPLPDDNWDDLTGMLEGDLALEADKPANYSTLLAMYGEISEQMDVADFVGTKDAPKSQELSGAIWGHIASGELRANKVVGYHWKGLGDASLVVGYGAVSDEDDFGCYKQSVMERNLSNKKEKDLLKKPDKSSFFPDGWTEAEVRMAIEYSKQENKAKPLYTVTWPKKGEGMILYFNGDSYFPNL